MLIKLKGFTPMDTIVLKTDAFKMNDEEFFEFCVQNSGLNIERTSGKEIIIMSPSGINTSKLNAYINYVVSAWNEKVKKGVVIDSSGGFYLPNGAMRAADVAWLPNEKYNQFSKAEQARFLHYCPDFVIELKSPSDKISALQAKMEEWIANGCRLGWLIDPESERAYVYAPKRVMEVIKGFDKVLDGKDVLPGLELRLSDLKDA